MKGSRTVQNGDGVPAIPGNEHPVAADDDRAVQFRRYVGARPSRQFTGAAAWRLELTPSCWGFRKTAVSFSEHPATRNRPARLASTFQDDWRIGSRLTLNLGVRYEFETPLVEAENRTARGFDASASQAFEAAARAAYAASQATNPTPELPPSQFEVKGGLTFPGRRR